MQEDRVSVKEYIKLVREAVHGPRFEGFPIYGKVNIEDRSNVSENGMLSNQKWIAYTQVNNTSPNNIRAVFISLNQVVVIHYNSISKKTSSIVRSEKVPCPKSRLTAQDLQSLMGIFSHPWVCSNIEEIFVNVSLFMAPSQEKTYQLNGNESRACADMFLRANISKTGKTTTKEIFGRFTRLRAISCITPNVLIQDIINKKKAAIQSSGEGTEKYKDANIGLYEQVPNEQGNTFRFRSGPSEEYTLRKGEYIYDNKLTSVVELAEAVQKHNLEAKTKDVQTKYGTSEKVATEKPEIEKYLDAIEKREQGMARLAFKNIDKEGAMDVIKEFTAKGQEYYSKLLDIGSED